MCKGSSKQTHVSKNWPHVVSAHSSPRQFSNPSRSWLLDAPQLWKHTGWQSGVNEPTVPTFVLRLSVLANSIQSATRSVSANPARQIADVRGMTSLRVNQPIEVVTPIGGGGGGGFQIVSGTAPCGGGGGYAWALSQTTPSASLAVHGLSSAYMKPWMLVSTVETSTHRLSPAEMLSGCPSKPDHTIVPPSFGLSDQNAVTPRSRAYPSMLKASSVVLGHASVGRPRPWRQAVVAAAKSSTWRSVRALDSCTHSGLSSSVGASHPCEQDSVLVVKGWVD